MSYTTMLFARIRGLIAQSQIPTTLDANARVGVRKNSAGSTFLRRRVNLIEGTGVTLTVADDSGSEEVDVTIAASGGGGGTTYFDITGSTYEFPAGGGYDTIAQEDTGDGSSGYVTMTGGFLQIEGDDPGGGYARVNVDGTSPDIELKTDDGAGVINLIDMDSGGNGDISISATEAVIIDVGGGTNLSRVFIGGGGKGVVIFAQLAADPGSPVAGQVYYNTSTNKLKCYDGSTWQNLW